MRTFWIKAAISATPNRVDCTSASLSLTRHIPLPLNFDVGVGCCRMFVLLGEIKGLISGFQGQMLICVTGRFDLFSPEVRVKKPGLWRHLHRFLIFGRICSVSRRHEMVMYDNCAAGGYGGL